MRIAVYQTSPVLLDVQTNLAGIIEKIHAGREQGAQLIVFPELALTGYFVGHHYPKVALRMDSKEIRQIAEASRGTAAVVGFIEESPSMNFYNSALVAVDGELLFAYRKLNLPNYGVFEERKYFSSGKKVPVFRYGGFCFAVYVCNDLWHPSLPYLGVTQKADVFITVINSSKESMGDGFSNIESWETINTFYSRIFGIYNICANRVGEETFGECEPAGLSTDFPHQVPKTYRFWGGSEVINPYGQRIAKARLYGEDAVFGELSREILREKRIQLPYLRNDDPYFTHRELQRILFKKLTTPPLANAQYRCHSKGEKP